jgi:CheY-like chemotaxis protein
MRERGRAAVILLAEDNVADQKITRRALQRGKVRNDLRVVCDGEECLDYLFHRGRYGDPNEAPRPDVLLLDLNMPKVDGREVLAEMRRAPELSSIRVVVLTTSQQEEDILKTYDLGVQSYIVKPLDLEQFVKVVATFAEYWLEVVVLPPRTDRDPPA